MLCFTPVNFQKLIPAKYLYTSSMQQLAKNILFDTSRIFLKSILFEIDFFKFPLTYFVLILNMKSYNLL